jgi:hypothetical protein
MYLHIAGHGDAAKLSLASTSDLGADEDSSISVGLSSAAAEPLGFDTAQIDEMSRRLRVPC